jgi:hypothetical protein
MRNVFAALLFALTFVAAPAMAQELSHPLNWIKDWGMFDKNLDGLTDPVIPSSRILPKDDIKKSALVCPSAGDISKMKVYGIDIDSDGLEDVFIDPSAYFGGYPQSNSEFHNCPVHICDGKGCNAPLYHNDGVTQILEGKKKDPCPAKPSDNVDCRSECPATVEQCPGLFNHAMTLKFSGRLFAWSFISSDAYQAFRETRKIGGKYLYRERLNHNPVFRLMRDDSYCTNVELDVNLDGKVSADEKCIKYMQYVVDKKVCTNDDGACFVDLFQPPPLDTTSGNNQPLYIDSELVGATAVKFFQPQFALSAKGETMGTGVGLKLQAGHAISAQLPAFTGSGNAAFMCNEYINQSPTDVFIPAATDKEYQSFIDAAGRGQIPDVTVRACERKFTAWKGLTSCSQVAPACNEVITIAAHRDCQRSTSAFGACSECSDLADPAPLSGISPNSCDYVAVCDGGACPEVHNFCLAADTKILLADGSEKEIVSIKVGDVVKAFDSKKPNAPLKDAKVKAILVTGEKTTIALNDLKITAVHKVILENGKRVEAKDVKIGDKIVAADGKVIVVDKITKDTTPVTVYNLDVEGADGYIAGGLRVLDYPAP